MQYIDVSKHYYLKGHIPKVSTQLELKILDKINKHHSLRNILREKGRIVYCHRIASYFIKSVDFIPYFYNETEGEKKSEDYKTYYVETEEHEKILICLFNSGVFYYFWHCLYDGYHCGKANIENYPFNSTIETKIKKTLLRLADELTASYKENSFRKETNYKNTGVVIYDEFYPKKSKPIIDEIDKVLAAHYGFTEEELDFIINYDIKYRIGKNQEEEEE